ncbi:MAG: hypothetical protein KC910_29115 [Candidatus Eremiobacteraeota bacterium]|nr:hypothetical protein [Candidatus Eremiobacteraeota bacterium]
MGKRRGGSLIETTIGMFVLVAGLFVTTQLFHSSLTYSARAEQAAIATMLSQRTLAEIRGWARQPAAPAFNFEGAWAPYDGTTIVPPDYPEYAIDVSLQSPQLDSPCSLLEAQHAGDQRRLATTYRKVRVQVRWGRGTATERVSLTSLVSSPPRDLTGVNVVLTPVGAVPPLLGHDLPVTYQAELRDGAGTLIPDALFVWSAQARPGMGTVTNARRDGSQASLSNFIDNPDGSRRYAGGSCALVARTRYQGVDFRGEVLVDLAP